MTKEEFIKNSAEWQALNKIWKGCTPEQKNQLRNDFELLSGFINKKIGAGYRSESDDDYNYLRVSDEAKQFVISLVDQGEKNLYHSIMAVLNVKTDITKENLKEYYYKKYGATRPYLIENRNLVDEVIDLCWKNFRRKKQNN